MRVVFTKTPLSPISWAIRKVEKSEFSHVAIQLDNDAYVHATRWRLNVECAEVFESNNEIVRSVYLGINGGFIEDELKEKMQFMYDNLGKQYGYLTIFGTLLVRLFKTPKNIFKDANETFLCSEFVIKFLNLPLRPEIDGPEKIFQYYKEIRCYPNI